MKKVDGRQERLIGVAAAGFVLAFAAWRVLSLGMADHYATEDPERALQWRGDHPEALVRHAELQAQDPSTAASAEAAARRALQVNPLDGRAFRVLGQLQEAEGDPERAMQLYQLAIRRSPRDVAAQARLADLHLARGEVAEALARIDVMLRVAPELMPKLVTVLSSLAAHPAAVEPFAAVLERQPPWRERAVLNIIRRAADSAAIAGLMEALRQQPGRLTDAELSGWIDRLIADGNVGTAFITWAAMLPPERLTKLGNIYNGGFEWAPGQGGFDWRFSRIAGARIDRLTDNGAGDGLALRIAFEDRRVPFAHVRQLLALQPGRYRLAGRARPANLRTEPGLSWHVNCVPAPGTLLASTEPLRGHGPWRDFSVEFEVPASGCDGQWLVLRHLARIEAEQRIGGQAWFDDMRITRVR